GGRFQIPGVPRGRFVALATHPEYADGQTRIIVGRDPVDDVAITMRRGAIVAGLVTDWNGAPVLGASVAAQVGRGTVGLAYTDADGHYELRGLTGAVTLRATAAHLAMSEVVVDITPDDDGRVLVRDFRLAGAGYEVSGVVQDTLRRPIAGATVV